MVQGFYLGRIKFLQVERSYYVMKKQKWKAWQYVTLVGRGSESKDRGLARLPQDGVRGAGACEQQPYWGTRWEISHSQHIETFISTVVIDLILRTKCPIQAM